jgi:periplasmic protein TonB
MLARLPITLLLGAVLTVGMFWVLWRLISEPVDVGQQIQAQRIEFTRQRRETEVQTKEEERVQRKPPPPTPQAPKMAFSTGGVDNNVASLNPNINPNANLGKLSLAAGSDTDVLPLVRIPPDYPPRAIERGIEGWVIVRFTITATGAVKDPVIVDAQPKGIFDKAVLRSIVRWRYNPKVEGGVAVERVGVQTKLTFKLKK